MTEIKPTIVIGLGNPLMADEGIGVALVEKLSQMAAKGELPSDTVDYHDGGCGGMNLLHVIAGRKKAVLIDCAIMGEQPGTIRRFTPDDVQTIKKLAHLSLHEIDILRVIELARMLGQCPDEIIIFGIQPKSIEQKMSLSPEIMANLINYLKLIGSEIAKNNL